MPFDGVSCFWSQEPEPPKPSHNWRSLAPSVVAFGIGIFAGLEALQLVTGGVLILCLWALYVYRHRIAQLPLVMRVPIEIRWACAVGTVAHFEGGAYAALITAAAVAVEVMQWDTERVRRGLSETYGISLKP